MVLIVNGNLNTRYFISGSVCTQELYVPWVTITRIVGINKKVFNVKCAYVILIREYENSPAVQEICEGKVNLQC